MLTALHIRDESLVGAFRRKAPATGSIPGLLGSKKMQCNEMSGVAPPKLQLSRSAVITWWEDEDAHAAATAGEPDAGWQVLMRLTRALGAFPGLARTHEQLQELTAETATAPDAPIIAITIGTAFAKSLVPLVKVTNQLEEQFLAADSGALWGVGMAALPLGVATLTVWPDTASTMSYVRSGAHDQAMKDHYDPKRDIGGHRYVTDGGFFGFTPLWSKGALTGKNPTPPALSSFGA